MRLITPTYKTYQSTLLLIIGIFLGNSCSKKDIDNEPLVLGIPPIDILEIKNVIAFGQELSSTKKSPAIEYITKNSDVNVRAASNGLVKAVVLNEGESSDYEIRIQPTATSQWLIIYDHVLEVAILEGDNIQQGDILGKVGLGNRTELQLNKTNGANTISYCPLNYASNTFLEEHLSFMANWCLIETVIP
ncbi:peptidoglycan DD-metalloendopeptidase family protein [Arenibacter sp. ARW7G5Y1]|uniref:peptidoglycan DD-metalloendopeptidase family protein n=1 Tax=Arenibacter sp. ARW7G5Y1 TaxID=2135619 RepID=UPI000D761A79|nr:peptidoglycan DD-metalloendopeptidase family protein [Arenibacter sp. ARW7G5Y1]PXX24288.1 peptidase M23-like protein [Arenibacter sp. ARW7G5Y1]